MRFFAPAGDTCCTDGDEIWDFGPLLRAKFHPHWCNDKGVGPPKLNFLLRFDQDALAIKIWLDLLEGLWSYGGFKLRGRVTPKFSAPLAAQLCVRLPKVLEVQERTGGPLSPCQVWWGSDFTRRRGGQKR